MIIGLLILVVLVMMSGIHRIPEGYVGVYYRWGVLEQKVSHPGYRFMIPWVNQMNIVQTTVQTDKVENIPCGTSGGVMVYFDKIEVVNQLIEDKVYQTVKNYGVDYDQIWIYDKIHHEINQFCSTHSLFQVLISEFDLLDDQLQSVLQSHLQKWVSGVNILSIRVTKPRIPEHLRTLFEKRESEVSQYLIEVEKQNTQVYQETTQQRKRVMEAESRVEVIQIQGQQNITQQQSMINTSTIDHQVYLSTETIRVDQEYQNNMTALTSEIQRFTHHYLHNQAIQSLTSNLNLILGTSIPNLNIQK